MRPCPLFPVVALAVAPAAALITACERTPPAEVVAGDGVLCDLSRRLAGQAIRVTCLLGPNDDPHHFQLSPRHSQELRQARLVLINGYGLTPALSRIPGAVPVAELAVPNSPRLASGPAHDHDITHGVERAGDHDHDREREPDHSEPADHADHVQHPDRRDPAETNDHADHAHGDRDPHVWHDPRQAAALVRAVSGRLQTLKPSAAPAIQRREQAMLQTLGALHRWNQRQFASLPSRPGARTLATGHRSLSSLSRAYGLQELAVVDGLSSSDNLRPQAMAAAVAQLRRQNPAALFSEQWPAGKALSRISALSGIPLASAPLRSDGLSPEGADLLTTLTTNTCLIVSSGGGRCDRASQQQLIQRWQAIR